MFFSFNNGISSTANDIEIVKEGSTHFIKKLTNWQIVNGGQTTGTIASVYNENKANLENVFVPMKISVIKDKENGKEIIDKISRSANSQTAIKNSDFSANDPFLVDFEYFSRNEWIPNKNSKPEHNGILNVQEANILMSYLSVVVQQPKFLEKNILRI